VVGFELVELNRLVDPTYVSALNANRIIREALTVMAMRKMGLTEKHYLSPFTKQHSRNNCDNEKSGGQTLIIDYICC